VHRWWMDFGVELTQVSDGFEEQYSEYGPRNRLEPGLTQPDRRRESTHYRLLARTSHRVSSRGRRGGVLAGALAR